MYPHAKVAVLPDECMYFVLIKEWKFQDFFYTQILRETNFEEFRSWKTAIFSV